MSEENVNGPSPAATTEAEVPPARRRPLKMVDESAVMFMVRKDSGHLNEVRPAGGDSCYVVRVDLNRARRCPEEPGLAPLPDPNRLETARVLLSPRGTRPFDERLRPAQISAIPRRPSRCW